MDRGTGTSRRPLLRSKAPLAMSRSLFALRSIHEQRERYSQLCTIGILGTESNHIAGVDPYMQSFANARQPTVPGQLRTDAPRIWPVARLGEPVAPTVRSGCDPDEPHAVRPARRPPRCAPPSRRRHRRPRESKLRAAANFAFTRYRPHHHAAHPDPVKDAARSCAPLRCPPERQTLGRRYPNPQRRSITVHRGCAGAQRATGHPLQSGVPFRLHREPQLARRGNDFHLQRGAAGPCQPPAGITLRLQLVCRS